MQSIKFDRVEEVGIGDFWTMMPCADVADFGTMMPCADVADPRWNALEFAQQFAQAKVSKDYGRLKKLLAQVAESNYQLRNQWTVPRTIAITHRECADYRIRGDAVPLISFSTLSTVDALISLGLHSQQVVCGLNFANGKDVGGGYKHGATAQEEDLCRRIPPLYTSLHRANKDGLYPFGPSTCKAPESPEKYADVLYTADLRIAREGEEEGFAILPNARQVRASLVSAAAPNINFAREISDPSLIYATIQSIFIAPKIVQPEVTTLVLGAWGCGAFGGNAAEIAGLFAQAIVRDNLGQLYSEVHFAIPRTSPADTNHDVFREIFEQHHISVKDM
mmetsp:Transcript_10423/g.29395  ORF Transcript_10423/g.29395 Transcript_10423/m.29395 type:complete len:335 (-) Transcript_10423:225-1229(-)